MPDQEQAERFGTAMFRPGLWPHEKPVVEPGPPLSAWEQEARATWKTGGGPVETSEIPVFPGSADMRIREAMTNRVARIRAEASMFQAAEAVSLSGASDLMVVDSAGAFTGVLTEGDILRAALPDIDEIMAAGGSLEGAFDRFVMKGRDLASLPIMPLVIRNPLAVDPDDHVAQAAVVFVERNIRLLPVVRDGRLLGVISRADVCNAVVGDLPRPPISVS